MDGSFMPCSGAKVFPDGRPIIFLFKDYSDASWKAGRSVRSSLPLFQCAHPSPSPSLSVV